MGVDVGRHRATGTRTHGLFGDDQAGKQRSGEEHLGLGKGRADTSRGELRMEYNWDLVRHILTELEKPAGSRSWRTITSRGYSPKELAEHLVGLDRDDRVVTPHKDPGVHTDPDRCGLTARGTAQLQAIRKRLKFYEKHERAQEAAKRAGTPQRR